MRAQVNTPFFVLLDDDFVFTAQTTLERLLGVLERNADVDIASGALYLPGKEHEPYSYAELLEIDGDELRLRRGSRGALPNEPHCARHDIVLNFFVARTAAVRRVRWDAALKLGEHQDFFLRAKRNGLGVVACPTLAVALHDQVHSDQVRLAGARLLSVRVSVYKCARVVFDVSSECATELQTQAHARVPVLARHAREARAAPHAPVDGPRLRRLGQQGRQTRIVTPSAFLCERGRCCCAFQFVTARATRHATTTFRRFSERCKDSQVLLSNARHFVPSSECVCVRARASRALCARRAQRMCFL